MGELTVGILMCLTALALVFSAAGLLLNRQRQLWSCLFAAVIFACMGLLASIVLDIAEKME